MTDQTFESMGSHARIVCADAATLASCREFLARYEAALSRFRPDSELCRLNAADAPEVPASPLLRTAVASALWAAERTGGLVDPTLTGALEAAGYDRDRRDPEMALPDALAAAPRRQAADSNPHAAWRQAAVLARSIRRPPGLRFDTGGTGKGLAADLLAVRFGVNDRWAIDCGGDLRLRAPHGEPFDVDVRHPLTGEPVHRLRMTDGAVATSGLDRRLWRAEDGTPRHHLLDPATGEPAWTGVIGATALAPTALEAEALAKAALLSGPAGAGGWLRRYGGITFLDDGSLRFHGAVRPRPVVRLARVHSATERARRESNSPEHRPLGDTAVAS